LLGLEGIVVDTVTVGEDGVRLVVVGTADEWVGKCPKCRTRSSRAKGWVTTRPRDIKIGPDRPRIVWCKHKWLCTNALCKRKSFIELTPTVPARARMMARATSQRAWAVLDDDRSVAAVAAAYGCTWNTCHDAVVASAEPVLATEPEPVTVGSRNT
jgi:transposase